MFEKIGSLKKAIDRIARKAGNLVVLGDLNTMGLQFPKPRKKDSRVLAGEEIAALGTFAADWGMRVLPKDLDHTWTGGAGDSDLDHVVASEGIEFQTLGKRPDGSPAEVLVRGWQQLVGAARKSFVAEVSDHCSLYAEVK